MKIGNHDTSQQVLIIAEIGNNHEGDFDRASQMVDVAASSGVDAVKFQTFRTEEFISPETPERFARLKGFQLSIEQFTKLAQRARSHGLLFLSTPLDMTSATGLEPIVDAYKIASSDNDFYPLLERVAQSGKPVILSSGLADTAHMQFALGILENNWRRRGLCGQSAVLHCVTGYPVAPEDAHLNRIRQLGQSLSCTVGYSDHCLGIEAACAAVALGARIIEKHFTVDKQFSDFRDHQLSADPAEMKALVRRIREIETMLGSEEKVTILCEENLRFAVRRSVALKANLPAGTILRWEHLAWTRPSGGVPPGREHLLLGKALRHDVQAGRALSMEDLLS